MTTPSSPAPAPRPAARRELTVAVLAAAAAGGLALSAGGQSWADVTVTRQPPLPPVTDVLTGSQLAPLVPATGLLLLAGAVALIAVRGWGRVALGLVLAVAGGVLVASGIGVLTGSVDVSATDLGSQVGLGQARIESAVAAGWPVLAAVAGVLGFLAGLLVVLRGRRWPGLGQRYERTSATATAPGPTTRTGARRPSRPESPEDRHQAAWKALDRGDDPTDESPAGRR